MTNPGGIPTENLEQRFLESLERTFPQSPAVSAPSDAGQAAAFYANECANLRAELDALKAEYAASADQDAAQYAALHYAVPEVAEWDVALLEGRSDKYGIWLTTEQADRILVALRTAQEAK